MRRIGHYILLQWTALLLLSTMLGARTLPDAERIIRVGAYDNPPKIFTVGQDSVAGFWPDLMRTIAASEGWQLVWVTGTWEECLDCLDHNAIDLMPDVGWSEERSQKYHFSKDAVLVSWSRVYVPDGSSIETILDLDYKVIAGMRESINLEGPEGLRDIARQFNLHVFIRELDTYTAVFKALENHEVDAGITNKEFGNANENLFAVKQTPILIQPIQMRFGFPWKDSVHPELIASIDRHIQSMKADKTSIYYQLLSKWFGSKPEIPDIPRYFIWGFWVVFGLLVLFLVFTTLMHIQMKRNYGNIIETNTKLRNEVKRRKKSEVELQKTEELFRAIADHSMDNITLIAFDMKATYLFVSASAKAVAGYDPEELIGQSAWNYIHPDDRKVLRPILKDYVGMKLKKLLTGDSMEDLAKISRTIEYRYRNKAGEWRRMESVVTLTGKYLLAVTKDITDRYLADEALRESERKYKQLVEQAHLAILITDENGRVLFHNHHLQELFGYSEEELGSIHLRQLVHAEDVERVMSFHKALLSHAETLVRYEFRGINKDGRPLYLEISEAMASGDGQKSIRSYLWDISDRKQAEAATEASRQKYEALFDALPYGGEVLDLSGKIIDCSQSTGKLLGYRREELIGHSITEFVTQSTREVFKGVQLKIKAGQTVFEEVSMVHRSGRIINVLRAARPLMDQSGAIHSMLALSVDITERKNLEKEREEMRAELYQAKKLETVGTMVGGVAHDFNNILQSMFLYGDLVQEKIKNLPEVRGDFKHLMDDVTRAQKLVERILIFSRKSKIKYGIHYLQDAVREMLTFIRNSFPSTIKIKDHLETDCGPVLCDLTQIQQIVLNLCNNAKHALASGGELRVSMTPVFAEFKDQPEAVPAVELEIADTGAGMDAETLEKIFDPFFTTKDVGEGTGLGLSIVHEIVTTMKGNIHVESTRGKGTRFVMQFPVAAGEVMTSSKQKIKTQTGNSLHILFVDDEQSIRDASERFLVQLGHRVIAADDGDTAIQSYLEAEEPFDVVITDLSMPRMGGDEFTDWIRARDKAIPVILSTGNLMVDQKMDFRQRGITGFILKPWAPADLLTYLEKLGILRPEDA